MDTGDNKDFSHIKTEDFIPYFQPIIHTITRDILGYEVLGRMVQGESTKLSSLGTFFHEKTGNFPEINYIDRIIREKAILHLKNSLEVTKLFFNIMPNILSQYHQGEEITPDEFHIIQLIEQHKIDKKNIIIEITEEEFNGKVERLVGIVDLFRNYGFTIAIDDVGAGFSNLERIGYIHPDIIKVDIKIMRESLSVASFRHVLEAISEMAHKLGSILLFEGIESEKELNLALSMGASLLQGYYFSEPLKGFIEKETFSEDLKNQLEKYSGLRFLEIIEERTKQKKIIDSLNSAFYNIQILLDFPKNDLHSVIKQSLSKLPPEIESIFVTDPNGYQVSPGYFQSRDGVWSIHLEDIGNNYAWKPYFAKHKADSYFFQRKWMVTRPLYDRENSSNYVIFTYSITAAEIIVAKVLW
ncbi:MAG: EAL domain-containing protein [Leptospiraceae bacterium]|nr:EAL domain-containing protein [Leptospiraceae bacterium]MCP5511505.1 EAL domain-containing protein [Leptospiraceae bacterium]